MERGQRKLRMPRKKEKKLKKVASYKEHIRERKDAVKTKWFRGKWVGEEKGKISLRKRLRKKARIYKDKEGEKKRKEEKSEEVRKRGKKGGKEKRKERKRAYFNKIDFNNLKGIKTSKII